jgi:capsular polysaccharide biosynthesis protein
VSLFKNADIVIAPHGAGLTNITFCKPGTKCLEFISPRLVSDLFAVLSEVVGVEYYYLIGSMKQDWKDTRSNEEFELDSNELVDLFKLAGVASS